MAENEHKNMIEANLHNAKGHSIATKGSIAWKTEKGLQAFEFVGVLPAALAIADSSIDPITTVIGDIYILDKTRPQLTVSVIAWQSGTTVRISFSGSPDLSAYAANDFLFLIDAANDSNNGSFVITAVNDGSDYV